MQYEAPKTTKITLRADRATGASSRMYGAHLDTVGFNMEFILLRDPKLAMEVFKLYVKASDIDEAQPQAATEDLRAAAEEMQRFQKRLDRNRTI